MGQRPEFILGYLALGAITTVQGWGPGTPQPVKDPGDLFALLPKMQVVRVHLVLEKGPQDHLAAGPHVDDHIGFSRLLYAPRALLSPFFR